MSFYDETKQQLAEYLAETKADVRIKTYALVGYNADGTVACAKTLNDVDVYKLHREVWLLRMWKLDVHVHFNSQCHLKIAKNVNIIGACVLAAKS